MDVTQPLSVSFYGDNIIIYCIVISADISISHRDCTGYKSLPSVLIFCHIALQEVVIAF